MNKMIFSKLKYLDKTFFSVKMVRCFTSYVQGQESEKNIREYFYYIDHEGMLFLDDTKVKNFTSCFKEKKFLQFFFRRIRPNTTNRYRQDFPFLSLCGRERNYIRCEDVPIVFTDVLTDSTGQYKLSYAHAGDLLVVDFHPEKIYMEPNTGWVYHPAWENVGNMGLIRSKLALEFSKNFVFDHVEQRSPTHFKWDGKRLKLEHSWVKLTQK